MKLLLFGIISFLISGMLSNEPLQEDPAAEALLARTSKKFKELKSAEALFDMVIETPEQRDFTRTGEILFQGDKFRITFETQVITCDNKSIWVFLKDMNQVQINDYEPGQDEISPSSIFTIYQNDFDQYYIGKEKIGDIVCDVVDLIPMDNSKSYFKVRIHIDEKDSIIRRVKVFDKNGVRYTYNVRSLDTNVTVDPSVFKFDEKKYPDARIEDLRF